jgi:hypothetical protein
MNGYLRQMARFFLWVSSAYSSLVFMGIFVKRLAKYHGYLSGVARYFLWVSIADGSLFSMGP